MLQAKGTRSYTLFIEVVPESVKLASTARLEPAREITTVFKSVHRALYKARARLMSGHISVLLYTYNNSKQSVNKCICSPHANEQRTSSQFGQFLAGSAKIAYLQSMIELNRREAKGKIANKKYIHASIPPGLLLRVPPSVPKRYKVAIFNTHTSLHTNHINALKDKQGNMLF